MITNDVKEHVLCGTLDVQFSKKVGYVCFHGFRPPFIGIEGLCVRPRWHRERAWRGALAKAFFLSGSLQGSAVSPSPTDLAGYLHRVEDHDDKSALKSKPTCSSIHAGAPDQLA